MVRIRSTSNLSSDVLRSDKQLGKDNLVNGEEADVDKTTADWLVKNGYAEIVDVKAEEKAVKEQAKVEEKAAKEQEKEQAKAEEKVAKEQAKAAKPSKTSGKK